MKLTNEKFSLDLDPKETLWIIMLCVFLCIAINPKILSTNGFIEFFNVIATIALNN